MNRAGMIFESGQAVDLEKSGLIINIVLINTYSQKTTN